MMQLMVGGPHGLRHQTVQCFVEEVSSCLSGNATTLFLLMAERTVKGRKARVKAVLTVHVSKLVMQVLQIEFLFGACSHDNNY